MFLVLGRGEIAVLPAVLQYCYTSMLWIRGLIVMLLIQGREEMVVLTAVTAVLLNYSAMDTWTDSNFVSTG